MVDRIGIMWILETQRIWRRQGRSMIRDIKLVIDEVAPDAYPQTLVCVFETVEDVKTAKRL